jgi:hypothetical protein
MKILAKKFKFRVDLENEVRNKLGLTTNEKPDHTIEGTREELHRLQLSDRSIFWGIKCVITDDPTEAKKIGKPNRGQLKEFGINGRNQKPK